MDGSNEKVCTGMIVAMRAVAILMQSSYVLCGILWQVFATQPRPRQVGLDTGTGAQAARRHPTLKPGAALPVVGTHRVACAPACRATRGSCPVPGIPGVQRRVFSASFPDIFHVACSSSEK